MLDLNVVLDVFLGRQPWLAEGVVIWDANREGRIDAHLASFSVPPLFYVMRSQVGLNLAEGLGGTDFEDNLQIAYAMETRLEAIVTRDPEGLADSPSAAITPSELLARLAKPDGSD